MPLTLTIRNATSLDNGSPLSKILDRRGASVGRATTTDWCLPDPAMHISSRHCEIRYAEDRYELVDVSTNGTFLLGQAARLAEPRVIGQGDVFVVGRFEIEARLDQASASAAAESNAAPQVAQWQGWAAAGGAEPAAQPAETPGWGNAPAGPASSGASPDAGGSPGWGGTPQGWAAPAPPPATPPAAQGWGAQPASAPAASDGQNWAAAAPPSGAAGANWPPPPSAQAEARPSTWAAAIPEAQQASGFSSAIGAPPPATGGDVWGKFAASNVVDWARGGFGQAPPPPPPPPPSPAKAPLTSHAIEVPSMGVVMPAPEAPPAAAQQAPQPPAPAFDALGALAASAGIDRGQFKQGEAEALAVAGNLLHRMVAGLVVMLEARARGKAQMGAQGTSLEFDGNNPLKFARSPEQALVQLLNPPERGFMPSERAIEDAFKDLQAHQIATLMAMQGALRATLERFSPKAIRARAEKGGIFSKIVPGARDAALWTAYEKEFSGVAQGSDEAFMDMFAKEFRRAYEEIAHKK